MQQKLTEGKLLEKGKLLQAGYSTATEIGRASCRERVLLIV